MNAKDWLSFQKRNFKPEHRAVVACSNVLNVNVIASEDLGFTIGDGLIWFQKLGDAGLRVTVVNFKPEPDEALLAHCTAASR